MDPVGDITILLQALRDGVPGAADRLMARVYDELRALAGNRVGRRDARLEPTTLVHEAYLRLFGDGDASFENRHHFFWAAARAMRDILVERARSDGALKRGGDRRREPLDDQPIVERDPNDLLELNAAIQRLEERHPEAAHIVMLRFFAGLTREQIAELLGQSETAVWREWAFARAWLHAELEGRPPEAGAMHAKE